MRRAHSLALLALITAAGCAGNRIVVNGVEVYEKVWNQTKGELGPRAAFDLDCQAEMNFVLNRKVGRIPVEVVVTGCGREALYTRMVVGAYGITTPWHLTGAKKAAPAPAAHGGAKSDI